MKRARADYVGLQAILLAGFWHQLEMPVNDDPPARKFMKPREAALRLGLSLPTVTRAIRREEIPSVLLGRNRLIPVSALDRLEQIAAQS